MILEKNLEVLRRHHPVAYGYLMEHQDQRDLVEVRRSGNHYWFVGPGFRFKEKVELDERTRKELEEARVIAAIGFGLGYNLEEALKVAKGPLLTLIVEPRVDVFWAALRSRDLTHLLTLPRTHLLLRDGLDFDEDLSRATAFLGLTVSRFMVPVVHPGGCEVFGDLYRERARRIRETIVQSLVQLGNSAEDTLIGLKQMAENVEFAVRSPDIADLEGKFRGVPAIVVSAGPSLDKNFHLLERAVGKAVILCADTVLRKLLRAGIKPHVVAALERGRVVYEAHFRDVVAPPDVLLLGQAVVVPEVFARYTGPFALTFKGGLPLDEWVAWMFDLSPLRAGSSVAHMCYNLAVAMGCDPIVFVGQDLAYGEGGRTHSSATAWEKGDRPAELQERIEVPAWGGRGTVYTRKVWFSFLKLFEKFFAQDRASFGVRIINSTEGGAHIEGAEDVPLEEALRLYVEGRSLPCHPMERLRFPGVEESIARAREAIGRLEEQRRGFPQIGLMLDEIERLVEKVSSTPMGRRDRYELGLQVGTYMDLIAPLNQIVYFIGQSFITAMGAELAEIRDLGDQRQLERWREIHERFLLATRTCAQKTEEFLELMEERARFCLRSLEDEARRRFVLSSRLSLDEVREEMKGAVESGDAELFRGLAVRVDWEEAEDPSDLVLFGGFALKVGMLDLAKDLLRRALERVQDDPDLWNDYGVALCAYEVGRIPDIDGARDAFYRALYLDPDHEEARRNLEGLEDYAERTYRSLLPLMPNRAALLLRLADVLAVKHRDEEALGFYRRGLELEPGHWGAWMNYALVLERNGKPREAEEAHLKAREALGLPHPILSWNYAKFLIRQGRVEEAFRVVEELLMFEDYKPWVEKMLSVLEQHGREVGDEYILRRVGRVRYVMGKVEGIESPFARLEKEDLIEAGEISMG